MQDDTTRRGGGYELDRTLSDLLGQENVHGPATYKERHGGRPVHLFIQSDDAGALHIHGQSTQRDWTEGDSPRFQPIVTEHYIPPVMTQSRRNMLTELRRKAFERGVNRDMRPPSLDTTRRRLNAEIREKGALSSFNQGIGSVAEQMRRKLGMG